MRRSMVNNIQINFRKMGCKEWRWMEQAEHQTKQDEVLSLQVPLPQLLYCINISLVDKYIQTLNWGYVSTNVFISPMLSTFWWLLAFLWNSSINSFMVCPISPKFEYKFWKENTNVRTHLCSTSFYTIIWFNILEI